MEQRIRFIEHAGRPLLLMDFSDLWRVDEKAAAIEEARRFVGSQPTGRRLLVKELAVHDEPWVLASAVVGMRPMQKVVHQIVATFSGRKLAAFDSLEKAKDWLVAQQRPPAAGPEPRL